MYGVGGGIAGAGAGVLASTGFSAAWPFVLGVLFVVIGLVMVRVASRRKEAGRG
nr:peptidase [Kibdelosporangium sp. MJ126-NF4]CEL15314.1 hypothetical protein [Kibdelosporangium sp. MJ126-NF4]CTQ95644.1 hypothetical protein [Kibdelosporangium sp. MJ126-NF4]